MIDTATCARDVNHREHHGASCTDFHLKLQYKMLCVFLAFLAQGALPPPPPKDLKTTVPVRTALFISTSAPANNTVFGMTASICRHDPQDGQL